MQSKVCVKCKVEKPVTEFYIRRDTGGRMSCCKKCAYRKKVAKHISRMNNNIEKLIIEPGLKCIKCSCLLNKSNWAFIPKNRRSFYIDINRTNLQDLELYSLREIVKGMHPICCNCKDAQAAELNNKRAREITEYENKRFSRHPKIHSGQIL